MEDKEYEANIATLEANEEAWIAEHGAGKFVALRGGGLVGFYDDLSDIPRDAIIHRLGDGADGTEYILSPLDTQETNGLDDGPV